MAVATARQRLVHDLTRNVCQTLGHPQWTFIHRPLAGMEAPAVDSDNVVYSPQGAVGTLPTTAGIAVWLSSQPVQIRGGEANSGDAGEGQVWLTRQICQFPAVDDTYNTFTVQDDDFLESPSGVRYKIETPVISADEAYWTATLTRWH